MYKVRVIEKEFKIRLDDVGNELSRSVWDESIYFMVMDGPRKQDARQKVKQAAIDIVVNTPEKYTKVSVGRAYPYNGNLEAGETIDIPIKELV